MIRVRDLRKRYDRVEAVRGLSFDVREGDIYGFIGPNGAGKTTTIRILATLLEPDEGTLEIGGRDVVLDPEEVRRIVGYMPDYYEAYDGLTITEYLEFFAAAYRVPRRLRGRVTRDVLELTDLTKLADRLVLGLSKGQKQRLCLAKTLVHDPKVLILDEPAAGLDPRARIEVQALLRELSSMGKTIFISSHILSELADICNAVGIIEQGKMLASGSIDEIRAKLTPHRTVRVRLLAKAHEVADLLRGEAGIQRVAGVDERTVDVEFQGEDEAIARYVRRIIGGELDITSVNEQASDLQEIFMRVTKGEIS